jgi:hypothetical protein
LCSPIPFLSYPLSPSLFLFLSDLLLISQQRNNIA